MIEYIKGDIFNSPAQVIVNAVNTVGVMGKGIALAYKERYPEMFLTYRNYCEKKLFQIGKLMIYYAPDHWILLFPTKENWRNPSKIEYLKAGLEKFVDTYEEKGIKSIAFPKLGCGNGELNWADVRPVIEDHLKELPITIYIYLDVDPSIIPEHKNQKKMAEWLKENARDLSYNSVIDDIKTRTALLPVTYKLNGQIWNAAWDEGLLFLSGNEAVTLLEDEFFIKWDELRAKGIMLSEQQNREHQLLFALLDHLGYLSPITQYKYNGEMIGSGYQVNEGLGRAYPFKTAV